MSTRTATVTVPTTSKDGYIYPSRGEADGKAGETYLCPCQYGAGWVVMRGFSATLGIGAAAFEMKINGENVAGLVVVEGTIGRSSRAATMAAKRVAAKTGEEIRK